MRVFLLCLLFGAYSLAASGENSNSFRLLKFEGESVLKSSKGNVCKAVVVLNEKKEIVRFGFLVNVEEKSIFAKKSITQWTDPALLDATAWNSEESKASVSMHSKSATIYRSSKGTQEGLTLRGKVKITLKGTLPDLNQFKYKGSVGVGLAPFGWQNGECIQLKKTGDRELSDLSSISSSDLP